MKIKKHSSKNLNSVAIIRTAWYSKSTEQIEQQLVANEKYGLTSEQAKERLKMNGPNKLATTKTIPWIIFFLKGILEPLSIILLICGVVSLILPIILSHSPGTTEYIEFSVIMLTVFTNAIIGSVQEIKAQGSVQALKKLSNPNVSVIRDGQEKIIDAAEIVKGDLVLMKVGQFVPADIRLTEVFQFSINESALTGESNPISKISNVIEGDSLMLAQQENMAFMSTIVVAGRARGIVVENAKTSEMGHIANSISETKLQKTPLQIRLNKVTKIVTYVSIAIALILFAVLIAQNYFNFGEQMTISEIIILSVSSAIAIIPASLTIIVSVILSLSTSRMTAKNVIVKSLNSIETLGEINVICSDKTGTLTQNKMTVTKFSLNHSLNNAVNYNYVLDSSLDNHFVNAMGLNNDAKITANDQRIGLPTELALIDFLANVEIDATTLQKKFPRIDEIPFSSDSKLMTTVNKIEDHEFIYVKGALDRILKKCKYINLQDNVVLMTPDDRQKILSNMDLMSNEALRVLAFAYKENQKDAAKEDYENDLIFLGLAGIIDPPRPEAIVAVREARAAGIRTIMITGDHASTAMSIAKKIGIANEDSIVITGEELDSMSEEELLGKIPNADVFARVNPEHKTRIVSCLQSKGLIVAMTGDGINDAPSLRKANVGIAMGIAGTDAAKEAANVIITDDNFASIIQGVAEGRDAYQKIKSATAFVLGANPQIFAMFAVILIFGFSPLTAINILWFNLIVETILAIPIGMAAMSKTVMLEKPAKVTDSIFKNVWQIMLISLVSTSICVLLGSIIGYEYALANNMSNPQQIAQTSSFIIIIFSPIFLIFLVKPMTHQKFAKFNKKRINWWLFGAACISFLLNIVILFTPWINLVVFSVHPDMPAVMWIMSFLLMLVPMLCLLSFLYINKIIDKRRYNKIKKQNLKKQKMNQLKQK
ncbi:cation-translocating P-type ATPase [Spiroplasma endosymbiont of Labia minor]|uniref:cation-translocating P-type ATPase n=1 Tax=Spiroplasma endosymbiont of Labia minor TaxID=3066305 RepID=UPI0030D29E07